MMSTYGFNFNTTYKTLPHHFYTLQNPVPVTTPEVIIVNHDLARSMGLDFSALSKNQQAELFAGNQLPKGAEPFAQAYAGHQFGYFTMLGDGRAVIWGEHLTPDKQRLDIQLKGSGQTPYSRRGDGRATLGSMLREYLISESMYYLGIPTTRSLAVATTSEQVIRENPLPGAILTRVASSHIRVGTFEFAAAHGNHSLVRSIMNYTIHRHYHQFDQSDNKVINFIKAVMEKQAELIVNWMRVGFIHGVMNTDNMTLSGETIDYGPCAFMDNYDPNTVFSSIDHQGRYAFANQPKIAQWNLARLVETLLAFIDRDINKAIETATELVNSFSSIYEQKWLAMMKAKLGLFGSIKDDKLLVFDLLNWMHRNHADYTNTFLDLSQTHEPEGKIYQSRDFKQWYLRWQSRLQQNAKPLTASLCLMNKNNPQVIPRNHQVEAALEAAHHGHFTPFFNALDAFKYPYQPNSKLKTYQAPPNPNECIYQTFCGT